MNAVFRVTLKEAMRKRTFLVLCIVSLLYLVLWGVALYFFHRQTVQYAETNAAILRFGSQLVAIVGLNFSQMLVMLLTVMLGAGAISSEVESGLIHGILSRPIRRETYLTGKFLGLAVLACGFAAALYAAVLAMGALFGLPMIRILTLGQLLRGLYYYLLSPLCMLCLILLLGVRLRTIPCGILALFMFILGSIAGLVEMIGRYVGNADMEHISVFVSLLSPFNTLYNKVVSILLPSGGLSSFFTIASGGGGGSPSLAMMLYIYLVYMLGLYLLALWRFRRKNIT